MTQILLLGTFHFRESDIDFCTEDAQNQLWEINERLMKFNPDAIAVEVAAHAQSAVDASYDRFLLKDLSDFDKMRNGTLGTVNTWGDTRPIKYIDETIQVGYRLGKRIGADKIYAVDDDSFLDGIDEEIPEGAKRTFDKHWEKLQTGKDKAIIDTYRSINSDKWAYHHQQLYL
ncbi:MAG: DUF5694 domain-containing protein, partial [Defluviitaleaceae bacterium]|nr:DUF5694 domain-containing protein [Defluviitaleaceae bacterium]